MRYPKLRELKEAIKALIKGPYTSDFPYKEHRPYERFRGRPQYHKDDCMGCGACFQVCPAGAIKMRDEQGRRILSVHWDLCIFCGNCQANCPTEKGIMLSNEFDLATTAARETLYQEIEKEFLRCDCCSEWIAPIDQIRWVAKKLGPLCFSNASLMLFYLQRLDLAGKEVFQSQDKKELLRFDRIKVLCPRCRRQAVLKS